MKREIQNGIQVQKVSLLLEFNIELNERSPTVSPYSDLQGWVRSDLDFNIWRKGGHYKLSRTVHTSETGWSFNTWCSKGSPIPLTATINLGLNATKITLCVADILLKTLLCLALLN